MKWAVVWVTLIITAVLLISKQRDCYHPGLVKAMTYKDSVILHQFNGNDREARRCLDSANKYSKIFNDNNR